MYKNILLPIDITEKDSWLASAKAACDYASAFGSRLHILTVLSDGSMNLVQQFFSNESSERLVDHTKVALKSFVKEHIPERIEVQRIVGRGSVYECIISTANKINADLIVMAAHRPELKDYLLGPNAAKVVRHSDRSVLVVRDNNI